MVGLSSGSTRAMNSIVKLDTLLVRIQYALLASLFILMLALMLAQVFCRYFLEMPLAWSEEVARYMFIIVTYLGAAIAIAEKSHIEINVTGLFLDKFVTTEKQVQNIENYLELSRSSVTLIISTILAYYCAVYAYEDYTFNQVSTALAIPLYLVSGFIFASMILMIFHSLVQSIVNLSKIKSSPISD